MEIGGERRYVGDIVLADVDVVTTNGGTVSHQLREDVVAVDHGRCHQRRGDGVKRLGKHFCDSLYLFDNLGLRVGWNLKKTK